MIRGVPLSTIAEATRTYVALRVRRDASRSLRPLIDGEAGGPRLGEGERRIALDADRFLRRLGIRCLWRAAVVVTMLRRRGVAASIHLSVHRDVRRSTHALAHAECAVGGETLRPLGPEWSSLS
jgi:hypothetical protein